MFHENEIVMLFLCTGVLIFIFFQRKALAKLKGWGFLLASFIFLFTACLSTVIEIFILKGFFNYLEHFCYAVSGFILTVWCYKAFKENSE